MTNKLETRFFNKVNLLGKADCWPWLGSKTKKGYGFFFVIDRKRPATQVSWEIENKEQFPIGLVACHKCDNPNCVNPDHIFPGTYKENTADSISKKRFKFVPDGVRRLDKKNQTHCIHGHEFNEENTIIKRSGGRACRSCQRISESNRPKRTRKDKWITQIN